MRLPFGFQLTRTEDGFRVARVGKAFSGGLTGIVSGFTSPPAPWRTIYDPYVGQWQQDVAVESTSSVLTFSTVFACIRLISTDIGKLRIALVRDVGDVCEEFDSPSFSPVLRKPNPHQTRIKFIEQWLQCKLMHGCFFALKTRDARGVVTELRAIDPRLVEPLVSASGLVYYRLHAADPLTELTEDVVVPAREVIHDVHLTPDHPLIGISPIGACGLAATQGLKIQRNSTKFFGNQSRPGFVLTAPGAISDETAKRLKDSWEKNYGGDNFGRTAILGDGLEPKAFSVNANDAQLIEQLQWTSEDVCRAFGVPAYKVGVGAMPSHNNVEMLDQAYYSQTLQELIECIEALLDEGLDLPTDYYTEFDLDGLLRMDSKTRADVDKTEVSAGILSPNEARAKRNLPPVKGGESPYLQQQNYSLEALAKRDAKADPFAGPKQPKPPKEPKPGPDPAAPPDAQAPGQQLDFDVAAAFERIERALAA